MSTPEPVVSKRPLQAYVRRPPGAALHDCLLAFLNSEASSTVEEAVIINLPRNTLKSHRPPALSWPRDPCLLSPCPFTHSQQSTLWLPGWHSSPSLPSGVHNRRPRSHRLTAQQVPLPHWISRSQAYRREKGPTGECHPKE